MPSEETDDKFVITKTRMTQNGYVILGSKEWRFDAAADRLVGHTIESISLSDNEDFIVVALDDGTKMEINPLAFNAPFGLVVDGWGVGKEQQNDD